jgi:hypothetical protein
MRVLVEASTEREWVAQHLEQIGHEVIVADPNDGPMYGHRSRRIKTDRRDVAALTEACQHGTYRVAHRRSDREVHCRLNVRQELAHVRRRAISLVRSITRAAGLHIRTGRAETFLARLAALELSAAMKTTLAPLRNLIDLVDDELRRSMKREPIQSGDDQLFAVRLDCQVLAHGDGLPAEGLHRLSDESFAVPIYARFDEAPWSSTPGLIEVSG